MFYAADASVVSLINRTISHPHFCKIEYAFAFCDGYLDEKMMNQERQARGTFLAWVFSDSSVRNYRIGQSSN